jgi:hypothetical protein
VTKRQLRGENMSRRATIDGAPRPFFRAVTKVSWGEIKGFPSVHNGPQPQGIQQKSRFEPFDFVAEQPDDPRCGGGVRRSARENEAFLLRMNQPMVAIDE